MQVIDRSAFGYRNLHRWCNAIASVQAGQMAASAWVSLRVGGGTIAVAVPRDGGRQLCSAFLQVPWWGKVVSQSCGHWLQVGVDVIIVLLVASVACGGPRCCIDGHPRCSSDGHHLGTITAQHHQHPR